MTAPTHLPPYSGDETTCAKCQFKGAATQYMRIGRCLHDGSRSTIGMTKNERLHRECIRCGYSWDEALAQPSDGREQAPAENTTNKENEA